jgi:hypothetical protein
MDWGSLVERKIQEAIQAGEFDSLPGHGQKLTWEDDALVDRSWQVAYKLLKNAGLSPEWIEVAKEIRGEIEAARGRLDAARRDDPAEGTPWSLALGAFGDQLEAINRKIDGLNLKVPVSGLQMIRLEIGREIEACRKRTGA